MDEYPDLSHLADEGPLPATAAPTADTLERIVARARRGRMRTVAATVAAAALVGSAAGFLVARNTSNARPGETQINTGGQPGETTTLPAIPSLVAGGAILEGGSSGGGSFSANTRAGGALNVMVGGETRVFVRTTADGIQIRGYQLDQVAEAAAAACGAFVPLLAEYSDNLVAGSTSPFAFTPQQPNPVLVEQASVAGLVEGSPIWLATVRAGSAVAKVVAHFPDGSTDEMAPVKGWAVLAHHASGRIVAVDITSGTLQAFGTHGQLLGTVSLAQVQNVPPRGCGYGTATASAVGTKQSRAANPPLLSTTILPTTTILGSAP